MPFLPRKMPSWKPVCGKISIMVILSLLIISCSENEYTEILVAGGGTSGVAAGIQAAAWVSAQ